MIYLDSCILIYAMEDEGHLGERARAALDHGRSADFAISPLVMHECLVMPLRLGVRKVLEMYDAQFALYAMLDIDHGAYLRAAELRAATPGLKTIDALHLATAQLAGCTELWTNDRRLAAASGAFAVDVITR